MAGLSATSIHKCEELEAFDVIFAIGYMGIGLVWGWWIGGLSGRIAYPLRDGIAVGAVTLMSAAIAFFLAGRWAVLLFAGACGLTLYLHLVWRQKLIDRFGPPDF